MAEKLTIICATYNAQDTISDFFSSIKKQSCADWDLILIDGLSTDNTCEIIEDNIDLVSEYICEADNGIYDAWNKGIKLAKTEWICFVGADDILRNNFVEKYQKSIANLGAEKVDYICSKVNYIDDAGNVIRVLGKFWIWEEFKYNMTTAHVGSLHNIKLFKDVGLYNIDYRIIGDYELLLRKKNNLKTIFIDEILVDMKAGGMSLSFAALNERSRAQRQTAGLSLLRIIYLLIVGYIALIKLKLDVKLIYLKNFFLFKRRDLHYRYSNTD